MIQALPGYGAARVLREDDASILLRARREDDGACVLVLAARDADPHGVLQARLEHEYALRAALGAAWAALPLALLPGRAALVLADAGLDPLDRGDAPVTAPLAAPAFLQLASACVAALGHVHRQDLVHQDLHPGNILYDPASGALRLTGFGRAAHVRALARVRAGGGGGGRRAYMAPEQLGSMDRPVDTRSDLYALGVLLYQQLCGVVPFEADSAGAVARAAPAPQLACPGVDPGCAAIVMKLLSKCPDGRYQGTAGLESDLRHCAALVAAHGRAEPFALGCNDGAARLQMPARMVGRAAQLAELEEAALQVAGGAAPALVMVSGNAGTGKSALLGALAQSDALAGAIVVAARFEQHQRDVPYATLAAAFQKLVRQMLGQSEAALANWRLALRGALGANAGLMVALVPELAFVIGGQGEPAPVAPNEAEGRLQAVFRQFLRAFTGADSTMLLCLDDLQWVDPASLKLLVHLATHPDVRQVMIVGAYRAGEVAAGHPLALAHEQLRRRGVTVRQVVLEALNKAEAGELVAAALDCPRASCGALAALVYAKTGGNPFFTLQFLARLVESGLLHYEHASQAWQWDAQAIGARAFSDNVIDLMIGRLQQLPYATLELVKLLACLGHDARLDTVARAAGMTALETDETLWPAARLGLLACDPGQAGQPGRPGQPGVVRFVHDRVQEAAYSLMTQASLPERHLHIGRLLLGGADPDTLDDQVFAVVGHLNRARDAIVEPDELRQLARLNAVAGARARRAIAFDAARYYFGQAASLTPEAAWQDRNDATFALYSELAECELLCGQQEQAERLFAQLASFARSRLALARVALLRLALYQVSGRFGQAAAVALDALTLFGISFPDAPVALAEALAAERATVAQLLATRSIAALEQEAASTDSELEAVGELFADMGSSVFSARPELYPLLALKALSFTLRFGSTASSCVTYSRYAILLVADGAIPDAFAFSELALRLAARDGAGARRSGRLLFVHGAYVHSWRAPVAASVALLEQAFAACQDAGDLPHAGYAAHVATWNLYEAGAPLAEVQHGARKYQEYARRQNNAVLLQLLRCYEQLTLCLQGATGAEGSFDDERFAAAAALALMDKASFGAARARFHLIRQIAAFTFGRHDEALQAAEAAWADQHFFLASINESTHHFYHALTLAALYPDLAPARQPAAMAALRDKLARLRAWAGHCPVNFGHRAQLLEAELARLEGRDMDAMKAYDGALAGSRAGGFVQHEALAAELAAGFYRAKGFDKNALGYARDALAAYGRWGAYGKMRALERLYPGLARVPSPPCGAAPAGPALDLMAALRASQALSSLLEMAPLSDLLLRTVLEQSGAARALLLLPAAGGYRCTAAASNASGELQVSLRPATPATAAVPESVLQFVLRTRETVLLDDAQASVQFRGDPVIAAAALRSVLCLPLLRHGVLVGVLYLENALAPGVFTPVRVLVLELVAAQAAIALGNAGVVQLLGEENRTFRRRQEASARKAAYLGAMGEEVRAPLGAIAGLATLVLRGPLDAGQRECVGRIGHAAQGVQQVMSDVLDLSRIEAGTLACEAIAFDPGALAQELHAAAARRAGARGVACRLELDAALPRQLLGDPLRLGQLAGHLLEHALVRSTGGYLTLALACGPREGERVELRLSVRASEVVPHGGGAIEARHDQALLQPYAEAALALAREHGGSGLGMALAHALAERLGARLAPGAGMEWQLTLALPLAAEPQVGGGEGLARVAVDH